MTTEAENTPANSGSGITLAELQAMCIMGIGAGIHGPSPWVLAAKVALLGGGAALAFWATRTVGEPKNAEAQATALRRQALAGFALVLLAVAPGTVWITPLSPNAWFHAVAIVAAIALVASATRKSYTDPIAQPAVFRRSLLSLAYFAGFFTAFSALAAELYARTPI